MKFSRIFAFVSAMALMMSMAACNDDKKNSAGDGENSIIRYDNATEAPAAVEINPSVEAAEDGPRLFIKDTTVKAGEVAEVTIAIENAEAAWNMCGFHVTYPEELIPEMIDAEQRYVRKKVGEASEYNVGNIAMEWVDNKTEYLITNRLGCIFFTEIFDGDYGLNGDVVTLYLKVPEDAARGTEYPVNFMYIEGDIFSNVAGDKAMEKYVFENWKGGKIIVE